MIRRPVLSFWAIAACALVAATSLVSCSTFNRNDTAASVNGAELSHDDLNAMLTSDLGQQLLQATVVDGSIDGTSARSLISAWIALTAVQQAGLADSLDRTALETALATQFGQAWTDAPQSVRDLAILNAGIGQLSQAGTFDQVAGKKALNAAKVFVDSRYGTWDTTTSAVIPFK